MNILGAPWALTLPQVGFFTLLVNLFCLYYFAIRGMAPLTMPLKYKVFAPALQFL